MSRDHSLTIKQRRIDVYLPTLQVKQKWRDEAKRRGQSISEMVFQAVHDAIFSTAPQTQSNSDIIEENIALQEQNQNLVARNTDLEKLLKRAEEELDEFRARNILGSDHIKRLDPRLMRCIANARDRDGRTRIVDQAELKRCLNIQPADRRRRSAMTQQLEYLEIHGVIDRHNKGWKWHG